MDHQRGRALLRIQPLQPRCQQFVEHCLADPDGRIGPDLVDYEVWRELVGGDHPDPVGHTVGLGVGSAQITGPFVHVDCPHHGVGIRPQGECDGHRSIPTTDVDQVGSAVQIERFGQQDAGTRIHLISGENAPVGQQRYQATFGEHQVDSSTV